MLSPLQLAIEASFDFFDHEHIYRACDCPAARMCLRFAELELALEVIAFCSMVNFEEIPDRMEELHRFDFATTDSSYELGLTFEGSGPYTSHL